MNRTVFSKLLASIAAVAAIVVVARYAPYARGSAKPTPLDRVAVRPANTVWRGDDEVLVNGAPMTMRSSQVDDCVAAMRTLGPDAGCRECVVLLDDRAGTQPTVVWMQPGPQSQAHAVGKAAVRAEILLCPGEGGKGARLSYLAEPDWRARSPRRGLLDERRVVPVMAGYEQALSVVRRGWSMFVDEGAGASGDLRAAARHLEATGWQAMESRRTAGVGGEPARAFRRGGEFCLLSYHQDAEASYVVSLHSVVQ